MNDPRCFHESNFDRSEVALGSLSILRENGRRKFSPMCVQTVPRPTAGAALKYRSKSDQAAPVARSTVIPSRVAVFHD